MKRFTSLVLALTIAAIPQTGHAFAATNGLSVNPVSGGVFEVNDGRGARAPAFWCAAANYARRALKADWQANIYVVRGMGPSTTSNRGAAVHFTLDPAPLGITPVPMANTLASFGVGEHTSVQRANTYCR